MRYLFLFVVALTAALHLFIAWFEIFAWTSRGPSIFVTFPKDLFEPTKQMAANQGVYNAFLAIGLIWSLFINDPVWQRRVATCFLGFVFIAGVAAAITVSLRPGLFQMVPSGLGLLLLALSSRSTR